MDGRDWRWRRLANHLCNAYTVTTQGARDTTQGARDTTEGARDTTQGTRELPVQCPHRHSHTNCALESPNEVER